MADRVNAGNHVPVRNLADFRKAIREIARPYLFSVSIPYIGDYKETTILCSATELPGVEVSPAKVQYRHREINLGGYAKFPQEWECEFYIDNDMTIRHRIMKWMSMIDDPASDLHGAPAHYKVDNASVNLLRNDRYAGETYSFVGLFPIRVSPVKVAQAASTEVMTFTVTFAYEYWKLQADQKSEEDPDIGTFNSKIGSLSGLDAGINIGPAGVSGFAGGQFGTQSGLFGLNLGGIFKF